MFSRKSTKTITTAADVEGAEFTEKITAKEIVLGVGVLLVYSTVVYVISHAIANVVANAIMSVFPESE